MKLSYEQRKPLWENGYDKIPGVIPRVMVDAVLRAINRSIGCLKRISASTVPNRC